jgi:hypothetical protein
MLNRHVLQRSGRVKTVQHCFSRQFGETSTYIACPQVFHRRSSEGRVDFEPLTRAQSPPGRRHSQPLRLPPVFQFQTEQNQRCFKATRPIEGPQSLRMSTSESTQTVQSTNQNPPIGTPAWIGIPATNILRAQKFYQEVFDWKFHNHYSGQYADRLSVFTIPGAPTLMVS